MSSIAQDQNWRRALLWAGGLLAAAFLAGIFAGHALRSGLAWPCVFLNVTGIPCPTCGATRTFAALSEFNLWQALKFNPLLTVGALLAGVLPFVWKRIPKPGVGIWVLAGTLVLLNWAYLILFLPR